MTFSALAVMTAGSFFYGCMLHMPGESKTPPLPPITSEESSAAADLKRYVTTLAVEIGERNTRRPAELERAALWIEAELSQAGYTPERNTYFVDGVACSNIEVNIAGRDKTKVVLGAHYDSAVGSPGANDNGSGVAALLWLAKKLKSSSPNQTLTLVFFVNEEPPYFLTSRMGSRVWADAAKARGDSVSAMLSLETMGFYTDKPDSQHYPFPIGAFYPSEGNFLGFVANIDSGDLAREAVREFRKEASLPSEGTALPSHTTGVDWSDHASFWRHGWPALMVTDTAPFRYPHYHQRTDLPDKIDFESLARAVVGLEKVVRLLANAERT
ncbi:MAG: M28 family peptidase [Polyangiaceae bacterium]|nr:M28 family peptidase [Polyangiaceae bacterium]